MTGSGKDQTRLRPLLSAAIGFVLLFGGIAAHAHYSPIDSVCQEAERFGATDSSCTIASFASPLAIVAIVFGVLCLIGAALDQITHKLSGNQHSMLASSQLPHAGRHTEPITTQPPPKPVAPQPACWNNACDAYGLPTTLSHCDVCGTTATLPAVPQSAPPTPTPISPRQLAELLPSWTNICTTPSCDGYDLPTNRTICDMCGTETNTPTP